MARFDVYANANPGSRSRYPYVLDAQSPLLDGLETRLVIPLVEKASYGSALLKNLSPIVTIAGLEYVLLTPQMASMSRRQLGAFVVSCKDLRAEIVAAIDFLVSGF